MRLTVYCAYAQQYLQYCLERYIVQRPVQYAYFRATCFDYRLPFIHAEDTIDLAAVMQSPNENKKLALDQFMV